MNHRLRERVNMGTRGAIPTTDSHKQIHLDHLTYTLQVEERLEIVEKFYEFVKGFITQKKRHLKSPNGDIPDVHVKAIEKRITSVENDLKRIQKTNKVGC
jgi:hypothetical protein